MKRLGSVPVVRSIGIRLSMERMRDDPGARNAKFFGGARVAGRLGHQSIARGHPKAQGDIFPAATERRFRAVFSVAIREWTVIPKSRPAIPGSRPAIPRSGSFPRHNDRGISWE
jgi:hypothetical protein